MGEHYFRVTKQNKDRSVEQSEVRRVELAASADGPGSLEVTIQDRTMKIQTHVPLNLYIIDGIGRTNNHEYDPGDALSLAAYAAGGYVMMMQDKSSNKVLKTTRFVLH